MKYHLHLSKVNQKVSVQISGSKSETNRALILREIYPNLILENISKSDDSEVVISALENRNPIIDVHHAGTAMRFLTAYFSFFTEKEVVLTGSDRMKERPIKILVDALVKLGADIQYLEKEGYPPLRIVGKKNKKDNVVLNANISSQYITALLLIAPKLQNGLTIELKGDITSASYINMTVLMLQELGVKVDFYENRISVKPLNEVSKNKKLIIESDWSSASYFFSIVAMSDIGTEIILNSFKENSLQGDRVLIRIYEDFGVKSYFENEKLILKKTNQPLDKISLDLNNSPDIAQTIAVTCLGLGIECELKGLHTLKIKETDRLVALKNELAKLGGNITVTDDSLNLKSTKGLVENVMVDTYQDHRMAMAFAPLAIKVPILINNPEVVTKSYPDFWKDLYEIGFKIDIV